MNKDSASTMSQASLRVPSWAILSMNQFDCRAKPWLLPDQRAKGKSRPLISQARTQISASSVHSAVWRNKLAGAVLVVDGAGCWEAVRCCCVMLCTIKKPP